MNEYMFMGEPMEYWIELQRRSFEKGETTELIKEIGQLRGKINFYESRIEQMNQMKEGK